MTTTPAKTEQTTDELLQDEVTPAPLIPIPVVQQGPVRTQHPGVRLGSSVNRLVDGVEQIVGEDPRRARVILCATSGTAAFFVGMDRNSVDAGASARFNTAVVVPLNTGQALYARSATLGTNCQLSIITELYSDT